jgi:TIR domain
MAATGDGPGNSEQDRPGLGKRLFHARAGSHSGKLAVGVGADDTLVIADQEAAIFRWSLSGRCALPGAPDLRLAALKTDLTYGMGAQLAVSSDRAAAVVARGSWCALIHFTGSEYRTIRVPFDSEEFLVPATGTRFATHNKRCVRVRDFEDGAILWERPCPPNVAATAIDERGTTVAMAGSSGWLPPRNRMVIASKDGRWREIPFQNVPGTGCILALSPDGELAVCVSFREIVLTRTRTGEIVRRRPVGGWRDELLPALGARPQRLICTTGGQVLWLRGRRVVDVNWSARELRYLAQDGWCDDIALDHQNSRLAMVSEAGEVSVFEWRHEDDDPAPAPSRQGLHHPKGHVFISYMREDSAEVDKLQRTLEDAGIFVWRDKSSLWPGDDWRARVQDAITRDARVFIACFSSRGAARSKSYQYDELRLAADEMRLRRPGIPWLIPVRFDQCDFPHYYLGAGQTLGSFHVVDLFGPDRDQQLRRLLATVQRLLLDRG